MGTVYDDIAGDFQKLNDELRKKLAPPRPPPKPPGTPFMDELRRTAERRAAENIRFGSRASGIPEEELAEGREIVSPLGRALVRAADVFQRRVIEPSAATGLPLAAESFRMNFPETFERAQGKPFVPPNRYVEEARRIPPWELGRRTELYRQTDMPWGTKGLSELAFDPTNLLPGIGVVPTSAVTGSLKAGVRGVKAAGIGVVPVARKLATEEAGFARLPGKGAKGPNMFSTEGRPDIQMGEWTRKEGFWYKKGTPDVMGGSDIRTTDPATIQRLDQEAVAKLAKGQAEMPSPAAAKVVPEAAPKEPWQMRAERYVGSPVSPQEIQSMEIRGLSSGQIQYELQQAKAARQFSLGEHKIAVQKALSEGKPVPPEVLADYPDLKAQVETQARESFRARVAKDIASQPETVSQPSGVVQRNALPAPETPSLSKAEARKVAKMSDAELAAYNAKSARVSTLPPGRTAGIGEISQLVNRPRAPGFKLYVGQNPTGTWSFMGSIPGGIGKSYPTEQAAWDAANALGFEKGKIYAKATGKEIATQGGQTASRGPHTAEIAGPTPAPATRNTEVADKAFVDKMTQMGIHRAPLNEEVLQAAERNVSMQAEKAGIAQTHRTEVANREMIVNASKVDLKAAENALRIERDPNKRKALEEVVRRRKTNVEKAQARLAEVSDAPAPATTPGQHMTFSQIGEQWDTMSLSERRAWRKQAGMIEGEKTPWTDMALASRQMLAAVTPSRPRQEKLADDPRSPHAIAIDNALQANTVTTDTAQWGSKRNRIDLDGQDMPKTKRPNLGRRSNPFRRRKPKF